MLRYYAFLMMYSYNKDHLSIFVSPFSAVYRLLANRQGDKWFILERAVRTKEQFYMSSFTCWDSTMSTIEQIEIPIYEFTSKTLPMVCLLA